MKGGRRGGGSWEGRWEDGDHGKEGVGQREGPGLLMVEVMSRGIMTSVSKGCWVCNNFDCLTPTP